MNSYEEIRPISREEAVSALLSQEADTVCKALISVALYESDRVWAQETCLPYLRNENSAVRGAAATCLGHIARIHGVIDRDRVLSALRACESDLEISGKVADAIDDIETYVSE